MCYEEMNGKGRLRVSEHSSLYLDMSACCLVSSLRGPRGSTISPWIRPDSEALRGHGAFIRKMRNSPFSHKEPLAFIDETNVCV